MISSRVRATKFHHIRMGSANGSPPRSRTRAGSVGRQLELVAAAAQVGQAARADRLVVDEDAAVEHDQGVLERRLQGQGARPRAQGQVDPDQGLSRRAGEVAPAKLPTRTVASAWPTSARGSSAWCSKAAGLCRVRSGWATHSWTPCSSPQRPVASSEWATPCPAVMRFSWPARMSWAVPRAVAVQRLARQQPGDRLQAGVRMGADVEAGRLGHRRRAHVVREAPGADGAPLPSRRARRTGIPPTSAMRLGLISTQAGATELALDSAGGASAVPTGPLMSPTVAAGLRGRKRRR